jgi:16S rRNA (cytosine967-C5)-methyltransferase
MTLRVNGLKTNNKDQLAKMQLSDVIAKPSELSKQALYLERPKPIIDIPGFIEGMVSVQDEASQLVPELLQLESGQRVLDACAAPGGKTCHILESERSLSELVSVDIAEKRVAQIKENLERLGLDASLCCADILDLPNWWDGNPFDRILLDAPCSATGVIRRHPDIKLLRSADEVRRLVDLQHQILMSLWSCLKSDGFLLYTTCSLLPQENDLQIHNFLNRMDNAKYEGIVADWGVECRYGRQLLTGADNGPDGFFYSLLRKI